MASIAELTAMRHAIALSALGLGTASPNPPVGCVVLDRHGTVAGTGFHRRKGESHAEVHALTQAGVSAQGGTAVVTLEPCNHVGVTPACRQELLDAGIARVVIGVIDPTSRGNGGAAVLADAGVDVETSVLADEVLAVLGPWRTATLRRRPYLIWAHGLHDQPDPELDARLIRALRGSVDLAVLDDSVEEGIPNGHSPQHFTAPSQASIDGDLLAWLSDTYATGARSVLLAGSTHAATIRHNLQTVDEVVVALPRVDPRQSFVAVGEDVAPDGFQLEAAGPFNESLMIYFRRSRHREV
jgi:diaminohydroxyphosphoribosylaminopyrimidine deaminase / 5-amino-6-(5-phosphoribosylamino)uracil reductase